MSTCLQNLEFYIFNIRFRHQACETRERTYEIKYATRLSDNFQLKIEPAW